MPPSPLPILEQARRRAQRRRLLTACCWMLVATALTALALSSLDRLLRIEDLLGRCIWSGTWVSCCLLLAHRWLGPPLRQPLSRQDMASQVEQAYPQLRNVVTSGLAFSQPAATDRWAGSPSLRQAVVSQAVAKMEEVDWQHLLPRRPHQRAVLATGGTLVVLGALAAWAPHTLATGFSRLLNPWSPAAWPRETNLQFVAAPTALTRGDAWEAKLVNTRGGLPADVTMHFRWQRAGSQDWQQEALRLSPSGNSIPVRRPQVRHAFEYRATGGDHHTMAWQQVTVVAPPKITPSEASVPPAVQMTQPRQDLVVVPTAHILLEVEAEDDVALERLGCLYRRTEPADAEDSYLWLWQQPSHKAPLMRQQRATHTWHLTELQLAPGSVLEVWAEARNTRGIAGTTTPPLRMQVVSPTDLLRQIQRRESQLRSELTTLLNQQQTLRAQVTQWKNFPPEDNSAIASAGPLVLFEQRQIAARLVDSPTAVLSRMVSILVDLQRNHLQRPATTAWLASGAQSLDQLVTFPELDRLLGQLLRQTTRENVRAVSTQVVARQDEVIEVLQQVAPQLVLSDRWGQFELELHDLLQAQTYLTQYCQQLSARRWQAAAAPDEQEYAETSSSQRQLARRWARYVAALSASAAELLQKHPSVARQAAETVDRARRQEMQATMLAAADQIGAGRLGAAIPLQQQLVDQLQQLLQGLAGRPEENAHANQELLRQLINKQRSQFSSTVESQHDQGGSAGNTPGTATATTEPPDAPAAEQAARMANPVVQQLWGHLPQRQREQILQPLRSAFLAPYASEIESYFRALAQPESD